MRFQPRGERPQWEVIYERLATMSIDQKIEDEELCALLPDAPWSSVQSAFWKAVKAMEDDHKRSFRRVRKNRRTPDVTPGYRMVKPPEHEDLAREQHEKSKRRMHSAQRKAHSADRKLLDHDAKTRINNMEDHLGRMAEMIDRLETRQTKTEARMSATEKDSAELADRIDRLEELLRRHGIEVEEDNDDAGNDS